MKKILQISLLVIGGSFLSEKLFAQDPEFTQFYANPLYLNPALAGSKICPRVTMNYRMEWPGIYGTYSTVGASIDRLSYKVKGGIGLMLMSDRAGKGTLITNGIGLIYAPKIILGPKTLISAAIQVGYWQKTVDWSKLTFGDQIDAAHGFIYNTNEAPGVSTRGNFDLAAGLLFSSTNFYAGVAVHHILQPNESFLDGTSILPRKYTGHAGAIIPLGGKYSESYISPNILYQKQGDFNQLNLGLYAKKDVIVGGLWYRGNDSFIVLIGIESGQATIGYSYDVTISKLTNSTAGSHELSLGYHFSCKKPKPHYRPVSCPSF
ncbi:MAG TPA: type IX secretion system membrane protein PorP/SprF [Bacteroidia bacterium]|jgi:type IX secretion system PorP/SprF family membrane protein|nr:type IX secretion system membrane protein PorP/SprF [Bacteroidia bacterium]